MSNNAQAGAGASATATGAGSSTELADPVKQRIANNRAAAMAKLKRKKELLAAQAKEAENHTADISLIVEKPGDAKKAGACVAAAANRGSRRTRRGTRAGQGWPTRPHSPQPLCDAGSPRAAQPSPL